MSKPVPTTSDAIEMAIVDLVGLSNLTSSAIERGLGGDADFRKKMYGSSELYHVTDDDANGILHGVLKIDADLRGLQDRFSDYVAANAKRAEPGPVSIETPAIDNLRVDWADAVAQMVQALPYNDQGVCYSIIDKIEDTVMHAQFFHRSPGVVQVLKEMNACLTYLRERISMAAEDSDVPADEEAQMERAALLLRFLGPDPGTNAQHIVDLVTPFLPAANAVTAKAA